MIAQILEAAAMPEGWDAPTAFRSPLLASAPRRVNRLARDPRWRVRYVTAWEGDTLLGSLALCTPQVAQVTDPDYDLLALFPEYADALPEDARNWALLGGARDLAGGFALRRNTDPAVAEHIKTSLAAAAVKVCRSEGLVPAALYVHDDDAAGFSDPGLGGKSVLQMGETAVLDLPYASMDDYLESFKERRRYIRRDWRLFEQSGLCSAVHPAADVLAQAAPLVSGLKAKHDLREDPRIAAFRLRQWMGAEVGEYLAFTVSDPAGDLVAACFVCRSGESMEAYEIGLTDNPDTRLLGYLEGGFYAPIRYALAEGVSRFELGMAASATKRGRGATTAGIWGFLF
ncbi:GNAT family N-acetyltransferase [Streptomyces goshikiensis]|uniref:GNAT family N-acetyltransferase n=1 Tax=Streptomyces goshikiensis TaxID=1942 RepID=UPI0036FB40A5